MDDRGRTLDFLNVIKFLYQIRTKVKVTKIILTKVSWTVTNVDLFSDLTRFPIVFPLHYG
jgi:hypothetical protein